MIQIAVVEDEPAYVRQLNQYIRNCSAASDEEFKVTNFSDGIELVEGYQSTFDIIFMDIDMKHLDGMQTARRVRQFDKNVIIIFITNLAQYAIQGYEVEAQAYVLKPVNEFSFSQELMKAVERVQSRRHYYIQVKQEGCLIRLDTSRVSYIESGVDHQVIFHTKQEKIIGRETMKNLEAQLAQHHFSRCNSCYIVNLAYVGRVNRDMVTVDGDELQISRKKRSAFMQDLADYIGGV